jgi:oxygen-independent coproporphyrinogen-3 oxidase
MNAYSLYLHIPFCHHRCCYCDFNTYAGLENLIPAYVDSLCHEIELVAEAAGTHLPVHTMFFGGGTPSLLPAQGLEKVIRTIDRHFSIQAGAEITLEANPGTLSLDYLGEVRRVGINRISLGMQSANPGELRLLERLHGFEDVIHAVRWARKAGFENLNLDLIFGLPYQSLSSWQQNLQRAMDLSPEHLSIYALTLEHGTPMESWVARGLISEPEADLAAEMYEWACDFLGSNGFQQYEISNWALRGGEDRDLRCRHNLQYWRNLPYLGLGAGGHGFAAKVRTVNVLSPSAYIQRCRTGSAGEFPRTPATSSINPVDQQTEIGETMMMGLRLTEEGISRSAFANRFGHTLEEVYETEIAELISLGLLEWGGKDRDHLRLSPPGRLLGNQVFMRFI